jgi:hypothetical protein
MDYAWTLDHEGRLLTIYKIDSVTRQVLDNMKLARREAMTPAEAQKYVNDNFPNKGSAVRAASEALGSSRK